MFSTTQLDFIEDFIPQQYNEGNIYYLVHTNTNLNNYTSQEHEDLTIFVSSTPIEQVNDYRFTCDGYVLRYDVLTRNASNNYTSKRISQTALDSLDYSINNYEFIQTNAIGSTHMNLLALQEYGYKNNITYNMDLNDYFIIPFVLCISLLFNWLNTWFSKNRGTNL